MRAEIVTLVVVALFWSTPSQGEFVKAVPFKDVSGRIVNGDQVNPGELPWQAGIRGVNGAGGFWCGGSLISSEWVLTAGHCIDGIISATIYLGTTKISGADRVLVAASEFILHETYFAPYLTNDIGLIRLKSPVVLTSTIQPVALAIRDPEVGTNVTVSGWGLTSDSDQTVSDILYKTSVDTIENAACVKIYGVSVVDDAVICANPGSPFTSPCQGDSGAPVVVLNSCGIPVQIGVFSFTNGWGCEFAYPSGSTRVSLFRDWIKEKTGI